MSAIRTKRWNDPIEAEDGTRILVSRYRPRGLPKSEETWQEWQPNLGPSRELHAVAYGKTGQVLNWPAYKIAYLSEMRSQRDAIVELAKRVANGETITLLCSSACMRESRCHRSLLGDLIESAMEKL